MHRKALKIFYSLAIFVLMNALFVMTNGGGKEVTALRQEIRESLRVAFWQTVGDRPWFEDVEIAVRGIDNFYIQATDQMLAMLEPTKHEDGMNQVLAAMGNAVSGIKHKEPEATDQGRIAGLMIEGDFMQEEPLRNIVPWEESAQNTESWVEKNDPSVLGITAGRYSDQLPVNDSNEWVTIRDNYTGQLYCLAVYNSEINRYLGPCKKDEYR